MDGQSQENLWIHLPNVCGIHGFDDLTVCLLYFESHFLPACCLTLVCSLPVEPFQYSCAACLYPLACKPECGLCKKNHICLRRGLDPRESDGSGSVGSESTPSPSHFRPPRLLFLLLIICGFRKHSSKHTTSHRRAETSMSGWVRGSQKLSGCLSEASVARPDIRTLHVWVDSLIFTQVKSTASSYRGDFFLPPNVIRLLKWKKKYKSNCCWRINRGVYYHC